MGCTKFWKCFGQCYNTHTRRPDNNDEEYNNADCSDDQTEEVV